MTWEERPAKAGPEDDRGHGQAMPERAGAGSVLLRVVLLAVDIAALAGAWMLVAVVAGDPVVELVTGALAVSAGGLWIFRVVGLYRTSVCVVRSIELARLARACMVLAAVAMAGEAVVANTPPIEEVLAFAALSILLGGAGRSWYRAWVGGRRRVGEFRRPVLIVGANEEASDLVAVLASHPELGFRIAGIVGARTDAGRTGLSRHWRGDYDELFEALVASRATGAIVCATALEPARLNATVQKLLAAGVHVQLSSGLRGIQVQRLRPMPLAYEPLFYVEPTSLARWQLVTKRVLDVALSLAVLIVTAPVLVLTALLIRLAEGGPVIFRQERIGLGGRTFTVYKFRTMRVGAEEEHDLVRALNAREGPLFKARVDPRVTRLGRYLRSTGIDELPQLWNVLNGTMSLVGPRPALPQEVAEFDTELRTRETVRPGITGLWQVEARDNPSFTEYRRFDLFYIDNWSVTLDFVILWSTLEATLARTFRGLRDADQDVHLAPTLASETTDDADSERPLGIALRLTINGNGMHRTPAYAGAEGHPSSTRRPARSSSSSTVRT